MGRPEDLLGRAVIIKETGEFGWISRVGSLSSVPPYLVQTRGYATWMERSQFRLLRQRR